MPLTPTFSEPLSRNRRNLTSLELAAGSCTCLELHLLQPRLGEARHRQRYKPYIQIQPLVSHHLASPSQTARVRITSFTISSYHGEPTWNSTARPISLSQIATHRDLKTGATSPQEDRGGGGENTYRHRAVWVLQGKMGPKYAIGGPLRSLPSRARTKAPLVSC